MKVLFAGPSLASDDRRLRQELTTIEFRGPVARGDVARAALDGATAIGIVDGVFESTMAVWHKEILFALSLGIAVGGAASMGALRAAECAAFGMVGIGSIFRRYHSGESTDDADVGQIHAPAELGFQSLSEPWVNIEPTLRKMQSAGLITVGEFRLLANAAQRLHFKQRTYEKLLECMPSERGQKLFAWLADNAVDQRRIDAIELVDWLAAQPNHRSVKPDWQFSDTTHWRALLREVTLMSKFDGPGESEHTQF